jgi:uncharacterized membrane protein
MGPIGHVAIGFAAKPAAPRAPLLVLVLASEALDFLSFAFVAIGIENTGLSRTDLYQGVQLLVPASIPWSHGLFMSIVWSALAAVASRLLFRNRRTAAVVGLVVFSHWVLDFIVHAHDLPLLFGDSPRVGLCLWCSGRGLIVSGVLEIVLLLGGIAIYRAWRGKPLNIASSA